MSEVSITPRDNGPLLVKGPIKLVDVEGNEFETKETTYLCRCGASNNKPFCDGTHAKIDFKAVTRAK